MKYKFFDTHAHTNIEPLISNNEIFNNILKEKIFFNCIGIDLDSSIVAIEQTKNYPNIVATIGIHPSDILEKTLIENLQQLEKLYLKNKDKIVSIGETGLDYHYENYNKELQIISLIKHIELANKYNLPLMIHCREADEDCFEILNKYNKCSDVIIHCFSGTKETVKKWIEKNYYISIPGIITFKKNNQLIEAIKLIPIDKLLIETDSPFLSPHPLRGKINSPLNIEIIYNFISNILKININDLQQKIIHNNEKVFKFKKGINND